MQLLTVLKTGGEYSECHVQWLQNQVRRKIWCITDSDKPMRHVTTIQSKYGWPYWWSKMEMFRPDITGDFLYCDLDTVFLEGMPKWSLLETTVLSDMYGQAHINSGLMYVMEKDRKEIWSAWIKDPQRHMDTFKRGGDQSFLDMFWRRKQRFQDVCYGDVVSYKADVLRNGFRGTEKVVCFHGQPRPWAVHSEVWIPTL